MKLISGHLRTKALNAIIIVSAIITFLNTNAQETSVLKLPLDHGRIKEQKKYLPINYNNGIYVGYGMDSLVKTCEGGMVVYLSKNSDGLYSVSVKSSDGIIFNYSKLINVNVKMGQSVNKGSFIGHINERQPLFFSVLKDGTLQNPKDYLVFY